MFQGKCTKDVQVRTGGRLLWCVFSVLTTFQVHYCGMRVSVLDCVNTRNDDKNKSPSVRDKVSYAAAHVATKLKATK